MRKIIKSFSLFVAVFAICIIAATTVKASAVDSLGTAEPGVFYDTEEGSLVRDGRYYKITLEKSGTVTLTGVCIEPGSLQYRILDATGNILARNNYNGSSDTTIFTADLLAGTYYIGTAKDGNWVTAYKAKFMYTFEAIDETIKDSVADAHNSILTAGSFKGNKVNGFFALNDKTDVFEYKVSDPSLLTVTFTSEVLDNSSITIMDKKGNVVGEYRDIKLGTAKYQTPVAAGSYYVTVKASENSTGLYELGLKATKLSAPKQKQVTSKTYGTTTVKFSKVNYATGYEIQASKTKKFGSKVIAYAEADENTISIDGLKAGKTYYVRTRAVFEYNGQKFYSAWSAVKSIEINNKKASTKKNYTGTWVLSKINGGSIAEYKKDNGLEGETFTMTLNITSDNATYAYNITGYTDQWTNTVTSQGGNKYLLTNIYNENMYITYKSKSDTLEMTLDGAEDVFTFKRK